VARTALECDAMTAPGSFSPMRRGKCRSSRRRADQILFQTFIHFPLFVGGAVFLVWAGLHVLRTDNPLTRHMSWTLPMLLRLGFDATSSRAAVAWPRRLRQAGTTRHRGWAQEHRHRNPRPDHRRG
jgi:hypothetical protein